MSRMTDFDRFALDLWVYIAIWTFVFTYIPQAAIGPNMNNLHQKVIRVRVMGHKTDFSIVDLELNSRVIPAIPTQTFAIYKP